MATIRHCLRMRGLLFILMLAIPSGMLVPVAAIAQGGLQFNKSPVKGGVGNLDVKETRTDVRINLEGDVLFDFDKWDIRKEAEASLRKLAEIIKKYPKSEVLIEGHTDRKGPEEYNQNLSERRAASVKDWLVKKGGIEPNRMKTKGWGMAKPIAPNKKPDGSDNPEGRQKNRRVEILVKKK
jgi:outer membrane protein OmpA-like peptidoglycan-associated protein